MNTVKKVITLSLLLASYNYPFSYNDAAVNAFLHEPSKIAASAKEITKILNQFGLETGTPGNITPETIKDELATTIPADLVAFKDFIKKLDDDPSIKRATKEIMFTCTKTLRKTGLFTKQQLFTVAYVISLYFINNVKFQLINQYTQNYSKLSLEEIDSLYSLVLSMCTCNEAPIAKRILLILNCIDQLHQRVQTNAPIVITSMGSDVLLMEYLLVEALNFNGYKSITLNAIDQVYRSIDKQGDDKSAYIETFSKATQLPINVCVQGNFTQAKLNAINIFDSPYDYEQSCQHKPSLKSTIMIAVDPSMGGLSALFATPLKGTEKNELRRGINRVDIFVKDRFGDNFDSTIYLPPIGTPRIYWDRLLFWTQERQDGIMDGARAIATKLTLSRTQNIQAYDAALVQKIIDFVTTTIIEEGSYIAREKIAKKVQTKHASIPEEEQEKMIEQRLAQSTKDIIKKNLTVEYKRDPYILLQGLALECMKPNGFGYMLGSNKLIFFDLPLIQKTGSYSIYEQFGDQERRCILRSPEFIEQDLSH